MKKVGVVLSGCGFKDGAEVHESVLTLLAIDRAGAQAVCMAPNIAQHQVVNHLTGESSDTAKDKRNVLVESARIARGEIIDIANARADDLDALILPGGFGAALNLSNFAVAGPESEVDPGVRSLIEHMYAARKPIGAICIAPAVLARVLGSHAVRLTIGNDSGTAAGIAACGAKHEPCVVESIVVDEEHRIVSTPAYMLGPSIRHVAAGIELCVAEVMRLVG